MHNPQHNKNILFVCHDFLHTPQSCNARFIEKLASKINRKPGFRVDILCLPSSSTSRKLSREKPASELQTFIINSKPRLFTFDAVRSKYAEHKIEKILIQNRYDILHVFTVGELTAAPVELAQNYGLKVFLTLCDFWFLCEENCDLASDDPDCKGPENNEKCVQCFLNKYIPDHKKNHLLFPVRDHKKSRASYLKKIFKIADNIDSLSSGVKKLHEKFGFKNLNILSDSFKYDIDRIAEHYIQKYNSVSPSKNNNKTNPQNKKRILFYCFDKMHIPVLDPIYTKMKTKHPEYMYGFAAMPRNKHFTAGFEEGDLRLLKAFKEYVTFYPQEFFPDVTILPDSYYPHGCGKMVHVGHGVLSKGIYYTDTIKAKQEEKADMVCVPGAYHQQMLESIIGSPVMATGMPKLDNLFNGKINKKTVCRHYNLPESYTYILYAPTYNQELTSLDYLLEKIDQILMTDQMMLLIKLHSRCKPRHRLMAQKLVNKDPRIVYISGQDITEFLALADVMISDVSSAMMEFAALDKPLVLFNNPTWEDYEHFNPNDIDFAWRDIGLQITGSDQLKDAVQECLQYPEKLSRIRTKYTDQLFANKYNGDASGNIARLVSGLAES
ncbi:CDP-glycerol glycerophosphotransferase family protein [Desulfonatronovibrio magnus]|uniref:CDP-glycerol glycerophosphotransferase family protein n=1 Tax=Desulfonatronovibrio magnus TaxID=698827 RepID=UPI0005EBF10D|nr:CDP-glycerol glycerophosphotransferase family protein [Desulfonatronovibrio magnus]